jgi:2-polyprenyl-6-methoxyphenol hydroxylase-like FAD-dependent oxidoreductase
MEDEASFEEVGGVQPDEGDEAHLDLYDIPDIDEGPMLGLARQFSVHSEESVYEGETLSFGLEAKVVVVGAGPVGLWVAVQLRLQDPDLPILVLEKHSEYQRSHILRLKSDSFKGCVMDDRLRALVSDWGNVVRTNVMEHDLLRLAFDIGVQVELFELTSESDIKALFPQAEVLIGADGSHSLCRRLFFGEPTPDFHMTLQHTFLLKYEVNGRTRPLKKLFEVYPTLKILNAILVEEHIGKYNSELDRTPITLQMIISPHDFSHLGRSGMRSVMTFDNFHDFPESIQDAVKVWINVRSKQIGDIPIHFSEKINALPLDIYRCSTLAKHEAPITFFLVGDAAFAVPYFRALNNGLLCGTSLARTACALSRGIISQDDAVRSYKKYTDQLIEIEFKKAKSKRKNIGAVNFFTQISSVVPWQINRWSSKHIKQFKQQLPDLCSR